jgi:uncharacterized protein YeaO (DUF488 family)
MKIHMHRPYDLESMPGGYRVLVDRLWPRGVRKEDLVLDEWAKDLAPSTELRKWFGHEPARWEGFQARYRAELAAQEAELERLRGIAAVGELVLIYSARDQTRNQAVVLKALLEG